MAKQTKINFKTAAASGHLDMIKGNYQKIFQRNLKKGMKPVEAAKEAGKEYRKTYGSTPTKRWATARKMAATDAAKGKSRKKGGKLPIIGLGTMSVAER